MLTGQLHEECGEDGDASKEGDGEAEHGHGDQAHGEALTTSPRVHHGLRRLVLARHTHTLGSLAPESCTITELRGWGFNYHVIIPPQPLSALRARIPSDLFCARSKRSFF